MRLILEAIAAIICLALFAALRRGTRSEARRRRKALEYLRERAAVPAVFACGAQLRRVQLGSEEFTVAEGDRTRKATLAEGDYFIRCRHACEKAATCARFKLLADRCGEKTPVSLAGCLLRDTYLLDQHGGIAEICDNHPEGKMALVRGVSIQFDGKRDVLASNGSGPPAESPDGLDGFIEDGEHVEHSTRQTEEEATAK